MLLQLSALCKASSTPFVAEKELIHGCMSQRMPTTAVADFWNYLNSAATESPHIYVRLLLLSH